MEGSMSVISDLEQGKNGNGDQNQEFRTIRVDMPTTSSVDIEFNDITLEVSEGVILKKKKTILKGVSGLFKSGNVIAIMGPSGAGKSSLMNALTGFSTQGVTGKIRAGDSVCEFNNKANMLHSLKAYRKKSCYILQDDRLNPLFTVGELMKFAADMKLGQTLSDKLKLNLIREILETFGLSKSENTRCDRLSGGERKRVSIAAELIDNPPVVFLDEPTTGLDSLSTLQCIEMLKRLAHNKRTIICTIHQPSASIYYMFDQVYILADGMCIYDGPSEHTVPHLASFGLFCPKYHNPADYFLEIATGEYGKFNNILAKNCTIKVREKTAPKLGNDVIKTSSRTKINIFVHLPNEFYKFGILFKRILIHQYRDWTVTHLRILLHLVIGILLGLLYNKSGNDASKTIQNVGYILVSVVYLCYTSLMPAVLRFPLEMPVLKKENFNNWYNLGTYYAASLVTEIPMQIWYSFVYAVPSYLISGQPMEVTRFAMFVLALASTTLLADAVGNIIGITFTPVNGTFIGAITTCGMLVYAGFLALFSHMNSVMQFASHISFLKYVFEAAVLSVYSHGRQSLHCPESVEYCHIKNPNAVIKLFGLKGDNYWTDIAILFIEFIIFRIIAYFMLRRKVRHSS